VDESRDVRRLADVLVQRGWLSSYQAEQIRKGLGKELLLGSYVLVEPLGEGGMGTVFKARHRSLGRLVAIKIIRKDLLTNPNAVRRFQREIRAAAQVDHPNFAYAYDAHHARDTHFLVLEYVEGADLARLVKQQGPLPIEIACDYIRQAALGLQHAHERDLVHRDIKPGNLMVTPAGVVKILDMGLAQLRETGPMFTTISELTPEGAVMGTPDYMAPEQARGGPEVDIRADIYSLGCTLYFLLTRQPPFPGGTMAQKLLAHQQQPPAPLRSLCPAASAGLAAVIRKMMAKDVACRYQTPAEVVQALAGPFLEDTTGPEDAVPQTQATEVKPAELTVRRALRPASPEALKSNGEGPSSDKLAADKLTPLAVKDNALPDSDPRGSFSSPARLVHKTISALPLIKPAWIVGGALVTLLATATALGLWVATGYRHQPGDAAASPIDSSFLAAPNLPPIKVGVLHSLSGTLAGSEQPVLDATLLAIDEINKSGGVLGRRIEPVIADSKSDEQEFAARAEELLDHDGLTTLFGCWTSSSRKRVAAICERKGGLLVYPVNYEGLEEHPNVFYLGPAPNQELTPVARWAYAELGKRRFFLVGSDYVYSRVAHEVLKDELTRLGAAVVGEKYVPLGGTDFGPIVWAIQKSRADMILNTVDGSSNLAFFSVLRQAGIRPDTLPTVWFWVSEIELRTFSARQMAGDYSAWSYFQSLPGLANRDFLARYRARYGPTCRVNDPMETAYCGVYLWKQAVEQAGTTELGPLRAALKHQQMEAPEGAFRVDPPTQHTWRTARIGQITPELDFRVVWQSPEPLPPEPFPPSRSKAAWQKLLTDLYNQWGGRWEQHAH
jgi:urea transport system substrate-binding protein